MTTKDKQARLENLQKIQAITKNGYAGCLSNGMIVDRREHPEAVPMQANSLLGIPEPKCLPIDEGV